MLPWFGATALVWLHTLWWGWGLARWVVPRRWEMMWPVFVPLAGLALQSVVVWLGAYANFPGTDAYAFPAQIVPALFLATAWRCKGWGGDGWSRTASWHGATLLVLVVATYVFAHAGKIGLTTVSLGSCDPADYAAGARLMQEFSRSDRSGFLGLTEVVYLGSVNDFYTHFLRLNHFTPSAVVALNATVLGLAPWQLINIVTVIFLGASIPIVAWLTRVALRLRGWVPVLIGLAYGLSPITWYGLAHGAMSQLLAASAVAVVSGVGITHARFPRSWGWRSGFGLLTVAHGLIWGAYNFIELVAWMPALGFFVVMAWRRRSLGGLDNWLVGMTLPLGLAGVFFFERVWGVAERMLLFGQTDFGWKIPITAPEAWIGWVQNPNLVALEGWARPVLWGGMALALGVGIVRRWWRRDAAWAAVMLVLPALVGYCFLEWRGIRLETNASYDAYKILAVFFPGLLGVLGASVGWSRSWFTRGITVIVVGVAALGLIRSTDTFDDALHIAPLRVGPSLVQLMALEQDPEIESVNMLQLSMWDRLWSNGFLLRKPQYFPTYTYEGRRKTKLKGEWDITDALLRVTAGAEEEKLSETSRFLLVRRAAEAVITLEAIGNWYDLESIQTRNMRWRWTRTGAGLRIVNFGSQPIRARLMIEGVSLVDRKVVLRVPPNTFGELNFTKELARHTSGVFTLPPGTTNMLFETGPGISPGANDVRLLCFAVHGLALQVEPEAEMKGDP